MSHDDRYRGQTAHDVWGDDLDAFDDDGYDDGAAPQPFADQRIEDSDAFVRSTNGYVGDAEAMLRRILEIVATAPTMPLSSSPRLDRDELIELLEECLHRLPEEMRHARWMVKERQEFVAKTRREADELLEAARVQAERMVQRTEVVRAAEQRARQVVEAAETDARRLRHETEDFLDQRLASFEILLDKLSRTVHAGRSKLSIGEQPSEPVQMPRGERSDRGDRGGDGFESPGFFDQDR
ncbi:MAG: DivIVA domain-containing protein [Ilumatobacteraceae bacterium]